MPRFRARRALHPRRTGPLLAVTGRPWLLAGLAFVAAAGPVFAGTPVATGTGGDSAPGTSHEGTPPWSVPAELFVVGGVAMLLIALALVIVALRSASGDASERPGPSGESDGAPGAGSPPVDPRVADAAPLIAALRGATAFAPPEESPGATAGSASAADPPARWVRRLHEHDDDRAEFRISAPPRDERRGLDL